MIIINTQEEFDKTCKKLSQEEVIFVDTEFCRRTTYYAQLSIVQIASKRDKIIVDVMSGVDISGLKRIFADKNIVKVFHAPDQDFDIFYHLFGELPVNVFDTQIAAGVVGLDSGMGYARLCKAVLNLELDKALQKANWLKRPLSGKLLEYAIKDVEYLIPLYRELSKTINDRKLWDTYKERSKKLLDPASYQFSLERAAKKFNLSRRSEKFKNTLFALLKLREECAKARNMTRNFCGADRELVQVCERLPQNEKALSRLDISSKALAKGKYKEKLLSICAGSFSI